MTRHGITRKGYSTPAPPEIRDALARCSKRALIDILCDALGCVSDCEPEDLSIADLQEFCDHRLALRKDAPIKG